MYFSSILISSWISLVFGERNVPFLFPHQYFDVRKLQPFDAIYLNMMALSNYEYGGTTFEELNDLAEQREKVPRPSAKTNINRIFTTLKPDTEKISLQEFNAVESTIPEKDFPKPPPAPFNKRLRDDVENGGEEENPFEVIVTRAPPGFQRTRKRVRMGNQDFSQPKFLSRSSIIHPSTKSPPTTTKTPINDPKEGFEDAFVMPHARKLQQRDFDHEEHLQSEWAKKNEAKMSYRRHSGQNMTTAEQEEMAASYRKIKRILQGETVVDSYRTHRDKIRVEPAEEEKDEEADDDADSVDILDAIMEDEILESARENLKGEKKIKKTKKIEGDLPEFPTLSPIEPDDPNGESIPIPLSLPVALDNNPFSEVDMTRPTIVKLPLPPTMWNTEWITDFNK